MRERQDAVQTLARSRAYTLFSHLYLRGLTPEVLPVVRAIPDLAPFVADPFNADEAAADHYQLFSLDVFPYASLFLDAEGRLGGSVTDAVWHRYAQAGFAPDLDRESADHLGHELALLAWLGRAEADAMEDEAVPETARMRAVQQRFLDEHLLWWLPSCVQAVRQQGHPFYTLLADLTLEVVLDHRVLLGEMEGQVKPDLPASPDVLGEAHTGLKDIAAFLTTPAWSGIYLSRSDIARLGRSERLPRGFGSRVQTLTNLLRAAAEYDRTESLLAGLGDHLQLWKQEYRNLQEANVPGLKEKATVWLDRLAATEHMIAQMQEATRA